MPEITDTEVSDNDFRQRFDRHSQILVHPPKAEQRILDNILCHNFIGNIMNCGFDEHRAQQLHFRIEPVGCHSLFLVLLINFFNYNTHKNEFCDRKTHFFISTHCHLITYAQQKKRSETLRFHSSCRDYWTRTSDLAPPRRVRYQLR